jgi:hypothetical protein
MTAYDDDFLPDTEVDETNQQELATYDDDFLPRGETHDQFSQQDFAEVAPEALTPDKTKRNQEIMAPFWGLMLAATRGYHVDKPIETLIAEALRNLNVTYALFVDDELTVSFAKPRHF